MKQLFWIDSALLFFVYDPGSSLVPTTLKEVLVL